MDPGIQQYVDVVRQGAEIAHQTGLTGRIAGWITRGGRRPDYRERAVEAMRDSALQTLASLELTVAQALQILGPDFQLENLALLDPTWRQHWEEKARRVGFDDDERRTWWARLLAGEVQQPGSFSLRALALMDTLSTEEARLFTRVCAYAWMTDVSTPVIVLPQGTEQWHLDNAEELPLSYCGLIENGRPIGWYFTKSRVSNASHDDAPLGVHMGFGDDNYILYARREGTEIKIQCGYLRFTEVGKEVFALVAPDQRRMSRSYRDHMLSQWREAYDVIPVRLIDVTGDGSNWKFDPIKDAK